jgi:hypothetical protein
VIRFGLGTQQRCWFTDPVVQDPKVIRVVEEGLMVVLPMQIGEEIANLFQHRERSELSVDSRLTFAFCCDLALQVQKSVFAWEALIGDPFDDWGGRSEHRLHERSRGSSADYRRIRTLTEAERDRIDDQGFSRSCFSRKGGETWAERQRHFVDDRYVFD